MLFILKKWLGALLMPLPVVLMFFLFALILLFFTQKQKLAKFNLLVSFMLLFVLSFMPVSEQLVQSLESKYPPVMQPAQNFKYILVLGSGGIADPNLPVTGQLSAVALSRFAEALRLYHANPQATLIVSGGNFGDLKSHALLMQELAITMNIPKGSIIRLDNTLDTDDEAKKMSKIIKGQSAVLVTSATHMPRSMGLFHRYNAFPTPAPANYLTKKSLGETPYYHYIPSSDYLDKTKVAWHEYLGKLQNLVKEQL
ncbi:envelope biogenesis factor ElyC [Psychromonas sp. MB-3u-54]|uniref:ElyC/SanA/YdcF family protein n=1 Tax=Psychromonas sp. MB-3u-54 TaxID=2058319 RepID=UPI000C3369B9|nr:ElyC/SanA/YdcF family protein [Psychromonas sp. MB-3u-54]PKH01434.1 envelope biogenesis factor ElyC [Psychromonas sp. MB-3u-54]